MRTVYGKLVSLIVLLMGALLLFLPMRSGIEDHLYAYPHSIRMNKGDTYSITYALDSDHAQRIAYTSVDESIARVTPQGLITAVAPGATDIHLNAQDGARTTVHVEVAGTPASQLTLNTDSITMEKGQVTGLRASFNEGADDTRIEWRSMDGDIAQVDTTGRVTALRGGRTTIYAVSPSGLNAGASVFVHVSGSAVRITPEELTIGTGSALNMGAYYLPEDTTDEIAYWHSSDAGVLTTTDSGNIRAVGVGQVVLSVFTKEGLSASTVINVERAADRFDLSPSAVTIERGDTFRLEPRFLNANGEIDKGAQEHYIAWSSSNPDVATVENGVVTALRSGLTQISAAADGMTAVCNLRVQVLVHEISFEEDEVYLLREDTVTPIQLNAILTPSDPDDATVAYSTNNDLVANVDRSGLVTMTGGYGTAIITARASSGAEARFTLNVVTEIPDPNAPKPTTVPTLAAVDESLIASEAVEDSDSFSFDDIGNGVEAPRSNDELEVGGDWSDGDWSDGDWGDGEIPDEPDPFGEADGAGEIDPAIAAEAADLFEF